jgi:uncharacterized membrane protein YeiB
MRIQGLDIARSIAIFGMVLVNFKLVTHATDTHHGLTLFANLFEGRAAPLFVMLAGVGLSLMTRSARDNSDTHRRRQAQQKILKRGVVLAFAGTAFLPIWPADILHFYGLYFVLAASVIYAKPTTLIWLAMAGNIGFLVLLVILDYNQGWDWDSLTYVDLWTVTGFLRHWFYNGFHPVLVWMSFLLAGIWLGRQPIHQPRFTRHLLWRASLLWLAVHLIAWLGNQWVQGLSLPPAEAETLSFLFGTDVIPPMPLYVLSAIASSTIMICLSIELYERCSHWRLLQWLVVAGRQSLTLYVAHVFVGMGIMETLGMLNSASIDQVFLATALYVVGGIVFANGWARYFKQGPLEGVFRRITQ